MSSPARPEDHVRRMVEEFVSKLGEHCESVRIFVTVDSGECTRAIDLGGGNFYAQHGQIQEWLTIQDQRHRNWATRDDQQTFGPKTVEPTHPDDEDAGEEDGEW